MSLPRGTDQPFRVCLVCLGNICRSPMAEVVLRDRLHAVGLADQVEVDSAGTGDWHVGGPADERTLRVLAEHGYDGSAHRARQFDRDWFGERDLILVADRGHLDELRSLAPDEDSRERVRLLREFDPDAVRRGDLEVADPYFGEAEGFTSCLQQVERACDGLVDRLRHGVRSGPRPAN